ncbi:MULTISPECIES: hypothetical protein [Cysteiniphilum]|uniref:hypothetical protein n=1 Tax=Cysteiniphilum TaxID=2056696 RepID=UPI0017847AEE|nr:MULTISPECIES: hypothetical protein [Cysteiniphilum]
MKDRQFFHRYFLIYLLLIAVYFINLSLIDDKYAITLQLDDFFNRTEGILFALPWIILLPSTYGFMRQNTQMMQNIMLFAGLISMLFYAVVYDHYPHHSVLYLAMLFNGGLVFALPLAMINTLQRTAYALFFVVYFVVCDFLFLYIDMYIFILYIAVPALILVLIANLLSSKWQHKKCRPITVMAYLLLADRKASVTFLSHTAILIIITLLSVCVTTLSPLEWVQAISYLIGCVIMYLVVYRKLSIKPHLILLITLLISAYYEYFFIASVVAYLMLTIDLSRHIGKRDILIFTSFIFYLVVIYNTLLANVLLALLT